MNIRHLWSIQAPSVIHVDAPPEVCLSLLDKAAQPSIERLHLRDTFTEGRRYFIAPTSNGFRMTTTSKALINRRRTESLTVLSAQVLGGNDQRTTIAVRAHIRPISFFSTFWIPAGMIWLLWPVPWARMLVVGLLTAIFGFVLAGLRYGAALESSEMIYSIPQALSD